MPLNCSRAKSRNSYSQSWTSVRPSACVANTVTRLTRSLGKPGHRLVVMRPGERSADCSTRNRSPSAAQVMFIRFSTAATTSMSAARAPLISISPPVTAATTAQLPASM
jgi:hypothetical protein